MSTLVVQNSELWSLFTCSNCRKQFTGFSVPGACCPEKCMTIKDIFWGLSRSWNFQEKIQDFQKAWQPRRHVTQCIAPLVDTISASLVRATVYCCIRWKSAVSADRQSTVHARRSPAIYWQTPGKEAFGITLPRLKAQFSYRLVCLSVCFSVSAQHF